MISAVVWDMGGIMYRYFTELLLEVGAERGWPIDRLVCGPTGALSDPAYADMLEGRIDEQGYLGIIVSRLRALGITFDPLTGFDWPSEARPRTWAAIREIHAEGILQGLLTNDATKWLGPSWWETWEPAQWFDAMVDVASLESRKPSPEPYLAVSGALGVAPADCVFVDDMPVNCRGAEAVGMESHWFDITRPDACADSLLARLGLRG